MDGVGLISEAKAGGSNVPFILVTGQGDRDVDMHAMAAGAIDYLSKAALSGPMLERAIRYANSEQVLVDAVRREAARTVALDEVSQVLALEGQSHLGLDRVLGVTEERLGYGCSAIYLLAADLLTLGAARGFSDPVQSLAAESGPLSRALAEGHASILPSWTGSAGSEVRCQYVIPMVFETRTVGLFTVAISDDQRVDDPDQAALQEIATRVGSAIGLHQERTWLAERRLLLRRAAEFTQGALHEAPGTEHLDRILTRLQVAFMSDGLALATGHDDEDLMVTSAIGSLADRIGRPIGQPHSVAARARERRLVQVDSSGTSCAAYAPVVDGHTLLGLLWVDRRGLDASYQPHETETLALLGTEIGVVLSVARERALAMTSGVRNEWSGTYTRPFFDALLASQVVMEAATGSFGMVLVAPQDPDRISHAEGQHLVEACARAASAELEGGPVVVAAYGPATLAVLVREQAAGQTAAVAAALAVVTKAAGHVELAVGWAIRVPEEIGSIAAGAEMALEMSRRTRAAVQG